MHCGFHTQSDTYVRIQHQPRRGFDALDSGNQKAVVGPDHTLISLVRALTWERFVFIFLVDSMSG